MFIWVLCVLLLCYMGMVVFECSNALFGCYVCYLGVMCVIWVLDRYVLFECYNGLFGVMFVILMLCVLFGCYMGMVSFEC